MPSSRPRIVIDKLGICNACTNSEDKFEKIDWDKRREEFLELVEPYKSKNEYWDCVVPWSGGKDSSTVAYKLKFEHGLNPLLVTFSPQVLNELGNHNREQMIELGFDHLFFRPNQKVHRYLSRRFFIERGNQKVPWDAGVNSIPLHVAVKYNIPVVFYAEHGESEYGGMVIDEESKKTRKFTEVLEHLIGDDPRNWVDDQVKQSDLNPYLYPQKDDLRKVGVRAFYYSYYFKWSMFNNYKFIKTKINFQTHHECRTPGTFTDFDSLDDKSDNLYYYMQFIKFGFGRAIRDASRLIQNKQMTREEGLELVRKYDGEYPDEHLSEMLDYLRLTVEEFSEIVDKHRNPEIWTKEGDKWSLKYPPE